MLSIIEQFSAVSKSNCQVRFAMTNTLHQAALDSVAKLIELNLSVVKASLVESSVFNKQLFSAKDPQEFFNLAATHTQPVGEKMFSYGQRVATVASATQAEFSKITQAATAEIQHNAMALVEEVFKKAPTGSESTVSLVKSAIGNTTAGLELLNKGTQQAFGVLNGHQATTTKQASKAA